MPLQLVLPNRMAAALRDDAVTERVKLNVVLLTTAFGLLISRESYRYLALDHLARNLHTLLPQPCHGVLPAEGIGLSISPGWKGTACGGPVNGAGGNLPVHDCGKLRVRLHSARTGEITRAKPGVQSSHVLYSVDEDFCSSDSLASAT